MTANYLSDGGWITLVCTLPAHRDTSHYDEAFNLSWSTHSEADG